MSNRIQILNENVINRISAGEVVERPASAVKELVENAIDGQSTSIELAIQDGGKKLIRVKDNGVGMGRDDAFLSLERHATRPVESRPKASHGVLQEGDGLVESELHDQFRRHLGLHARHIVGRTRRQ